MREPADDDTQWWRECNWHEWLTEIGSVDRPTEDAVMRTLALQTKQAQAFFRELRYDLEYESALRHVLHESSVRELHARRGLRLVRIDLHNGTYETQLVAAT